MRAIVADRGFDVVEAVPWYSEGRERLLGARLELALRPPARVENAELPTMIWPNHQAPPGTPPLRRTYRITASGISLLSVNVELDSGRVVQISPEGEGIEVGSARLLGDPVTDPYYQPEPGN